MATIDQLTQELITLIKSVDVFSENAYSIYDLEDLMRLSNLQSFPLVGVGYNGAAPLVDKDKPLNVSSAAHGVRFIELQFIVVIALQYQYAGQEDSKPHATNLLDEVRSVVLGYRGVNSRPWVFIGERPEPDASTDGVVFYSQVWHTVVPAVGNFNQS